MDTAIIRLRSTRGATVKCNFVSVYPTRVLLPIRSAQKGVPMIHSKAHKQPKPKIIAGPKGSPANVATMPVTIPLQDRIRERAYELYQTRDCEPGQDVQDWLRAEQEIIRKQVR